MRPIFILFTVFSFVQSFGQNMFSVKSGNWNDSTVWNTLAIPSSTSDVTISSGDTVFLNTPSFVNNITLNSGSVLDAASGSSLTVKGDWINSGNFICNTSAVIFSGSSSQYISGTSCATFYNVEVNNINGLTFNSNQKIKKVLNVIQGTVYIPSGKLTLLSDSNETAAIAPLLNGADVQGKIAVQRYISSNVTGWRFLGSPVRTTLQDWADNFLTSGFPGSAYPAFYFCSIYGYDETAGGTSANGYVMPANVTDSLLPGKGYWCWIGPTPSLVEVTGNPGKFNHTFSVSLTPSGGKNEDGWNMVSNPYPCAIDWDSPSWTKTGIQNAIYVWDPVLDQYSTYINGMGINGGSNIIPSSQAFWVEANQSNPVLACDENVKTTADISYQKTTSISGGIKLTVQGNGYIDEAVICFSNNGSISVKPSEDAVKLFSDNPLVPSLTSLADTTNLAVNTLPVPSNEYTVPVSLKVGVSGVYTISNNTFTFPLNCCVFLEDRLTGAFTDMKTASSYSFYIADTTIAPRFLLHVSKPLIKSVNPPTCSYKQNGKAVLATTLPGKCTYTWKDAIGNPLTVHFSGNGKDSLLNLSPGYYYVDVTSKNNFCGTVTEEVIVDAVMPLAVAASVVDNTCLDSKNGAINILNVAGGSSPYYYKWSDNKTMASRQNLEPGFYSLVIIDSKECFDTSYYFVKTKSNLRADFKIATDTSKWVVNQPITFKNESNNSGTAIWNFGDATSNSINAQHAFASVGMHTVVLTVKDNYCVSSAQRLILIKEVKPVEEKEDKQVKILNYEDKAMVQFNLDAVAESSIKVFNAEGKLINLKRGPAHTNSEIVALGESHGMYIVQVEVYGLNVRGKVIK